MLYITNTPCGKFEAYAVDSEDNRRLITSTYISREKALLDALAILGIEVVYSCYHGEYYGTFESSNMRNRKV